MLFSNGEEGEDEVRLDEEMERVVWSEAAPAPPPPAPTGEPRRDVAAPLPFAQRHRTERTDAGAGGSSPSSEEQSPRTQHSSGSDHPARHRDQAPVTAAALATTTDTSSSVQTPPTQDRRRHHLTMSAPIL
ncbi:uncharacterized protein LOC113226266 [Hyposmocoma kahamanoa]|uniref:uncharacterized protein LOC113226266 n=1 Tax=Hyposmocoma kahamanoa TaxID=1477025 RepID=UPI000E6D6517|nr:uncharacterized protein LOC113226266 [Hyposmocoma kahamanoa]